MTKNNTVDTAQKGQTTTKNNIPTGKVKTLANATERRKAREEQFRNFRINALKRRCKRMGFDEAKTNEYVEKLKKQMDAPKEYTILVMFNNADFNLLKEAVTKAGIKYNILVAGNSKACISYGYMSLVGDQVVLAKVREIAPPSANIHPYAKKMESVIPAEDKEVIKKPSNNTAEKKAAAKSAKNIFGGSKRYTHRQKGRIKTLADIHRASRYVKKHLKKGEKIDVKKVFKVVEERKKGGAAETVQLESKKSSTASKKASTGLKKAA